MKKLDTVISNAFTGERAPFSLATSKGSIQLDIDQKREYGNKSEISYISKDQALRVFLTLLNDKTSVMLSIEVRLYALKNLPYTLNQIRIADLWIPAAGGKSILRALSGGFTLWGNEVKFPPLMLRDTDYDITEEKIVIRSNLSGRSSDENLPIWVAQVDDSGGIWYGPEWSGSWEMAIECEDRGIHMSLLLPTMDFMMVQGEEIALPSFLLGEYNGDIWDGSNSLRYAIREKLTPKIERGETIDPPVVFQGLDGMEIYQDEDYLVRESRLAAEIGIENFVFDAGWNHGLYQLDLNLADKQGFTRLNPWPKYLGQWTPSKERFPSGMDAFSRHVKSLGMRFGIWTEPRVAEGTPDYKDYHDILLKPGHRFNETVSNEFEAVVRNSYLVDLGKKRGEDYYVGIIERFVEEYGANWLWFDYNTDPRPTYWEDIEEPNRKGLCELSFYKGLYSFFDRIHEKYPQLWIESCASGGRIMDLGVLRRCHSIWVSDFSAYECIGNPTDMDISRNMRSGLNKFIPAAYIQNAIFIPKAVRESETPYALYNYLCHFAGALQYGQGLLDWKESDVKMATYVTSKYKSYRRYLEKDFYQLVSIPENKKGWDGWQFDERESDSGILVLFRMEECEDETFTLNIRGLNKIDSYRFEVILGNGTILVEQDKLQAKLSRKRDAMLVYYSKACTGK